MSNNIKTTIVVDGSCSGNPGPGGWAAILLHGEAEKVITGGAAMTTNNRMELTAVIAGLRALKRPCEVVVVTDSEYVRLALTDGVMRANSDLVAEARRLAAGHVVEVQRVAGHAGHALNERADRLAVEARKRLVAEAN
jgi:ribonuclease HI